MKRIGMLCVLFTATIAHNVLLADDYHPPIWRTEPPGQGLTTYQCWEFSSDDATPAPDCVSNPAGTSALSVMGDWPYTVWMSTYEGASGVWRFEDYMMVTIDNHTDANPVKEVWLQITYTEDDPFITTEPDYDSIELIDKTLSPDGVYWNATYRIILSPNPQSESIAIVPTPCTMYVDQLVIDTICTDRDYFCVVGFRHFARFAEHWLQTGTGLPADLYEDEYNIVDWLDLGVFVEEWLYYCPYDWPLR